LDTEQQVFYNVFPKILNALRTLMRAGARMHRSDSPLRHTLTPYPIDIFPFEEDQVFVTFGLQIFDKKILEILIDLVFALCSFFKELSDLQITQPTSHLKCQASRKNFTSAWINFPQRALRVLHRQRYTCLASR
jgi:hypothetical protein